MNSSVLSLKQQKIPLWFVILLIAALIFTISSVAVFSYKKSQLKPAIAQEQSVLESRKQLILLQKDVIDTNWLRTLNPMVKDVQGRLIWSTTMQQGIMEFENLPELGKNQTYKLWVYDLVDTKNEPRLAATFNNVSGKIFLRSFNTEPKISSPFKFELVLQSKGSDSDQPLLLAQP